MTLDPSARHVSGDSRRLQQVVWNLLSNAIKFTPSGGRIDVRMERAGSEVQIVVSDTGQGISPDFLPYVFDRFRQADATSTRKHTGLGLGLSIVRHLVELHGGGVHAASAGTGSGAAFTIRLPLAAAHHRIEAPARETAGTLQKEERRKEPGAAPSHEGLRVLLVDDDRDTLQVLAVMLADYQAKVHVAASASEAIEVLQWYKPDVLVSDLAMPDEDGYQLIAKIRALEAQSDRQTPAVALTAYVRVEDRARALSAGFNMFVPKPVEPNELVTAIAALSDSASMASGRA